MNDIPVQNKSAIEIQELVRSFSGSGLVLALMKSPPVLSPMTPIAAFPIGQQQQQSNNKAQGSETSSNASNFGSAFSRPVTATKGVQVSTIVDRSAYPVAELPLAERPQTPVNSGSGSGSGNTKSIFDKVFNRRNRSFYFKLLIDYYTNLNAFFK